MKLKMIEAVFEYLVINTVFILVSLIALLPAKVQEQVLAINNFFPLLSGRKDTTD